MSLTDPTCPDVGEDEEELTLSQMRELLRRLVGNPSSTDVPDSELNEYLNMSYKDIVAKYRFHRARTICYINTVSGTARYFLPREVGVLKRVWNHDLGYKITRADIDAIIPVASEEVFEEGQPTTYTRIGRTITLRPVPNGVWQIDIYYKRMAASLTADDDVPFIPSTWHIGIVYYAESFYWKFRQDHAKQQLAFNDWKVWVSDKPTEMDEEMRSSSVGTQLPQRGEWSRRRSYTFVVDEEF